MFDEGISHTSLLVDLAAEANIIQKSGAWYSYGDQRIGQGRENAKLFLRDNPPLMAEVEGKVKELLGMQAAVGAGAGAADGRRVTLPVITALEPDPRRPGTRAGRGRRAPGSAPCRRDRWPRRPARGRRPRGRASCSERLGRGRRRRSGVPHRAPGARAPVVRPGRSRRAGCCGKGIRGRRSRPRWSGPIGLGLLDDAAFAAALRRRPGPRAGGARRASRATSWPWGSSAADRPGARRASGRTASSDAPRVPLALAAKRAGAARRAAPRRSSAGAGCWPIWPAAGSAGRDGRLDSRSSGGRCIARAERPRP